MGQCPVHSSNSTLEFIKAVKLKIITIPSYTPCLNPAEKLTNSIKMKLKMIQTNGRVSLKISYNCFYRIVSLRAVTQAFDSAAKVPLSKYIYASTQEIKMMINQADSH